ncbi:MULTISPECIES: universal stress protein [unclassified Schlesneria]|uniref:universal stress protein n=1 Tax=Schlesneria TaxID=656899 RepID=UPI0035A16969
MRILLAVDGSRCSDAAIDETSRMPWPSETIVKVVIVDAPLGRGRMPGSSTAYDELVQQQRQEVTGVLQAATARLRKAAPHLTVQSKLLEGNPKDGIVREAEDWQADLIVVGSHGYGPIRRFFMGSVSMFVAHNAPCSVYISRSKDAPTPED